ncbi:MAG: hypothetical protein NTW54_12565 [Bacteroidetes bacterium]|nr:hypothetical protein [Bacteroidota bacterium]
MLSPAQLRAITNYLQTVPELSGCKIGHYGSSMSEMLHPGNPSSPNYSIIIIIDEFNIRPYTSQSPTSPPPTPTPAMVTNDSRVGRELIGVGLSCGLTIVSGVGFVGALAAEGPSLGTSTFLAVAAWTGMVAGYAQCLNGIYRTTEASINPNSDSLEQLDNNAWYSGTFFVIDALGVASGVAGLAAARGPLIALLERRASLPAAQQLERMTRPERDAAMREALRRASQDPSTRRELTTALQKAFPERNIASMIRAGGSSGTIRTGSIVSNVISEQIARNITAQVVGIISSVAGIGVSATPSSWTGSGSGSLNTIGTAVINIIQPSAN